MATWPDSLLKITIVIEPSTYCIRLRRVEFYRNLYHLNVSEEPETDYPKNSAFINNYGPRGIIESYASKENDKSVDPRFGVIGKQTIKDVGPLTSERMKTFDEELVTISKDFVKRAK